MASFAYLFERFPSLTQTFCYREVGEMARQGAAPPVFSIRRPADPPRECPAAIAEAVTYLPEADALASEMKTIRMVGRYPWRVLQTIHRWGKRPGKGRLTAAAWLGPKLKARGVTHVHTHFAGMGARTAYWLKQFYGITYSFTGHANDLFCEADQPVGLGDLVREASAVVTVADYSLGWLQREFPAHAAKMHRVYNGIETAEFAPPRPDPAAPPLIVSVGRCIEKKGYADLIDACALLREGGARFECVIVGGGPLEEALRGRIAERGLEATVRLTGALPQSEVRCWLSRASLFALACATEADGGKDNLPTVIAEAMACGLPVVSTRLAGVPEMVAEGATGLLVEEKRPEELAGALRKLLGDPEQRLRLGRRGKEIADERFALSVTARQLRELLEALP